LLAEQLVQVRVECGDGKAVLECERGDGAGVGAQDQAVVEEVEAEVEAPAVEARG